MALFSRRGAAAGEVEGIGAPQSALLRVDDLRRLFAWAESALEGRVETSGVVNEMHAAQEECARIEDGKQMLRKGSEENAS